LFLLLTMMQAYVILVHGVPANIELVGLEQVGKKLRLDTETLLVFHRKRKGDKRHNT